MTSRKRKSLSSILKTQSPSRTALLDLNPNLNGPPSDETTHLDLVEKKKKRRSSRRVSFAETYQVKEFMKDCDRKELGLWDDSQEGTTQQELPDLEQGKNPSDPDETSNDNQAHHIKGLETLLSGPIKQEAHSMTSAGQDPYATSLSNVQSTSSAENLHQYPQDVSFDQRKNNVNETSVKSSFLRSFIAADSSGGKGSFSADLNAFAAPPASLSYPPPSGQQQQVDAQKDLPQQSSFKSSFLQAFVGAGPSSSSSSSEAAGSWKLSSEHQNAEPGMELTNCFYSSEVPNRCEGNKEKVGDITRIFGGQGDGFENDNGMDMTTCIGGFDTMRKKLERPTAESTRIFNSENTANMDLTACLSEFGGMDNSRSLGRTLNQTGTNMNFTQVFGKMSESDYADLPHESTARLLKRIDDAIAGSDGSGAETTSSYADSSKLGNMNVLHHTRDNTRKSVILDTIQEVSSSTASMLNVTSGDRSAVSAATALDACAEEDEMDITTCSNYTKDIGVRPLQQGQSGVPDNEDTAAMEMTCAVGNSVPIEGPSKVVSSMFPTNESHEDRTRVFGSAADDSAEMEMTCAINQPLVTGSGVKDGLSRAPATLDEDQTRVFNSEDTAAMEMTCVVSGASSSAFSVQNVHRGKMISSLFTRLPSSEKENAPSGPSKVVSSSIHATGSGVDHARVFDLSADDAAEMEMTCAISQPLVTGYQGKVAPSIIPTCSEDKTRIFDSENTAAMEMTCVIGGTSSSAFSVHNVQRGNISSLGKGRQLAGPSKGVSSIHGKDSSEDHTRVFNDSAEMEMTCAVNPPLITESQTKGGVSRFPAALDEDKTRIFDSENTAAMEMTCVIGGTSSSAFSVHNVQRGNISSLGKGMQLAGPSKGVSSIHGKDSSEDHIRVFNDSAEMEMTCAVNPPLITESQTKGGVSRFPAALDEDKTRVFNSDDTAAMEMTCAISQPVVVGSQAKGEPPALPRAFCEDKTRVFNSDDTAAMEMTCVMSGANTSAFSFQNVHKSTMMSSIRLPVSEKENNLSAFSHLVQIESTKKTEDTTCFENTVCLGDLPEGLAYQMRRKKEKQGLDNLQTDDTARMEVADCVSAPASTSYLEHAASPQISKDNSKDINGENTCYFTADNEDNMQMTECLDKQPGGSRSMMVRPHDHEQTKIFQAEETGNMEMTTCVGALQTGPPMKTNAIVYSDERTHVFNNEDTANMEMTCVGGVPPLPSSVKESLQRSSEEPTHISQSNDTANMEMTACLGAFPSMSSHVKTCGHAGEPLNSDFLGKSLPSLPYTSKKSHAHFDISALTFPRMKQETANLPQFSPDSGVESESTRANLGTDVSATSNTEHPTKDDGDSMQQQMPRVLQEKTQQREGEINISGDIPHDKTSDTYTLSNPVLQQDEDSQLGAELVAQEKLLEGRNSETFTINASSIAGSGKRKFSSLTEGNTTRTSSNSSEEGQSMADKEGSSSSPDMESHASFVLKDSIILPDWIDAEDEKGILDELPIDNDNTEDLCLTSTKRPRMDESAFISSQMDASYLTSNLSHLPLSSESGASSVADFLQMFFKVTDLPMGKRSIMCPTKINEPTTLSSHLENACLVRPKADMYEWAIKFLTPIVEELREAVRSQETKHLEESAPIIKEMQSAGPERCAEILKKGKSLQKYCTASSKAKMKGWRLQMINNTKAAMEDSSRHLENKVAQLTSSVSTIEEHLYQLASVDSALDDAIGNLEQIKVPTEEEKSEWIANSQQLKSMETKRQEEEKAVQEAESERSRLEAELKRLEESRTKLEAEREELTRLGTGSRQADVELETMKSEIILLHSFQEWKLQAFQESNYKFSFLNKSVLLNIEYGDTESGAKLNDLTLHSVLSNNACSSAKLAHALFFSSICADKLKTLYPTLADLPQMVQHLSELAGQVRLLEAEVSRIDFWHPVTTTQNRLSIEFSSVEAHSMFHIHLDIPPGQYPFTAIPHSSIVKIGKISEESINATMDAVPPGWRYITRITKAIEQLLDKHSSS